MMDETDCVAKGSKFCLPTVARRPATQRRQPKTAMCRAISLFNRRPFAKRVGLAFGSSLVEQEIQSSRFRIGHNLLIPLLSQKLLQPPGNLLNFNR